MGVGGGGGEEKRRRTQKPWVLTPRAKDTSDMPCKASLQRRGSDVTSQRPALHFYEEGLRSLQEQPQIRSVTGKEASSQEVTEQEVVLYGFPGV